MLTDKLTLCCFCRAPEATTHKEELKRVKARKAVDDPEAIRMMGCAYVEGRYGVARDHFMATQLFHRAANLGSHQAHARLAQAYFDGLGLAIDKEKGKYYV
jgi:TPR repeat protein